MTRVIRNVKATGKLVTILLLIAITFVYAMFQGGFVSWFLFYSFLPFGLYSIFLAIYPMKDIQITRKTNQSEYMAGESFVATITLKRKIPFPLIYLIIEELLPTQLESSNQPKKSKVILFPWFKKEIVYQYMIDSIPRGEHQFEGIRLKTGDLFGLIEKEGFIQVRDYFLIYPQYVDMIYRQLESRFEQGSTSSNVKLQRETAIAIGIREYKPGDRFSWIDWKASARKNDIMTKEFEQQQTHDVIIFMDRTKSEQFEQLVVFTASLVRAILKKGAQISLVSVGEEESIYPLRSGEIQQQQIYYHLAKVKDNSSIPFSQIVESEIKKIYQPVTFLLVTNKLRSDMVQIVEGIPLRHANLLLFVVKERATQLSRDELEVLEVIRKRNIFVKVVHEGNYTDVFLEVSKS
ncbi:DUF58 domain-containing protein [Fredinandcohnia quinoae]|uniref:DUF58 domain-containing protein n=1 Tax=Fredinandcohnia quinoae TaxID=2918902 RepID=A0AAW5E3H8_9BACI|nr:DUF58 domain-containing protein [Fredinandcohnia sp. SECRCQ15]MCH1627482.1 DUF58 domain-containing protein [Fredinandcohnia sp. SECRCQ15]